MMWSRPLTSPRPLTTPLRTLTISLRTLTTSLRVVPALAAVAVGLLVVLGSAGAAQAHARFVGSDPANGASLTTAPSSVKLTFSEDVLPGSAKVRLDGPQGTGAVGEIVVRTTTVAAALPPDLATGTYTVTWRVTSVDGHPISGALRFTLTLPAEASMSASDAPPTATSATPSTASSATASDGTSPSGSPGASPPGSPAASQSGSGGSGSSPSASLDTTPVIPTTTTTPAGGASGLVVGALAVTLAVAGGLWWWRSRSRA